MAIKQDFEYKIVFKRPELFRGDLEKIEKVLRDQLRVEDLRLYFGSFETDQVSDLPLKGGTPTLSIYNYQPNFT